MFLFFILSFCLFPSLCTKSVSSHENNQPFSPPCCASIYHVILSLCFSIPANVLERLTLFAASTSWPFAVWLLCLPLYWNSILTESLITSYFPHLAVFSKLSSSDPFAVFEDADHTFLLDISSVDIQDTSASVVQPLWLPASYFFAESFSAFAM